MFCYHGLNLNEQYCVTCEADWYMFEDLMRKGRTSICFCFFNLFSPLTYLLPLLFLHLIFDM